MKVASLQQKVSSTALKSHLWNWRYRIPWWSHLNKHLIKPLKGTMQMDFNPARCTSNILPMILSSPALDETQTNWTHLHQLKHSLKIIVDWLWKQLCKFLVVENFQCTSWWNLANCGRVKPMAVVTIPALNKNGRITQAFSINFSTNIIQMNAFSNVSSCVLNGWVTIDIT